MVSTREQKRVVAEGQHPLYHSGTVELICAFVGPGHWAFKAPISKLWLQSYRKVPVKYKTRFAQDRRCIQMTQFECAFASKATLRHALDYGLDWKPKDNHTGYGMFSDIGKYADKEVLSAAFKMGMPKHTYLNNGAAAAGDLVKLKLLCKKMKCPLSKDEIMVSAVKGGSVPLLRFLVKEGCLIDVETLASAARSGSTPVLEYLLEQEDVEGWYGWLDDAACSGHLHVLRWAAAKDTDGTIVWNDRELCGSAAQSGSIEMMQFLQEKGANLAEHNVTSDDGWEEESITTKAARGEQKHMLLWLKQQGILPTVHAMRDAAELDMLDMCLFLHTECSCPWDASVLSSAANNSYFELIQALHERGCPIDVHPVRWHAARYGRIDMLQYLLQLPDQPVWTPEQLTALLNLAGLSEHLAVAKWLRQQGAEWPEVLGRNGSMWKDKLLQWARRQGCTSSELPAYFVVAAVDEDEAE
jgi:hypothetical protein